MKSKNQLKSTTKFNGISLIKSEIKLITFYEDNIDKFLKVITDVESNRPEELTYGGDLIKLNRDGSIRLSGTRYSITDVAFFQIINYLGIPIKFSSRLSSNIFIELFNKMMGEHYERNFTLKVMSKRGSSLIIGFHPERKVKLPSTYNIFSNLMKSKKMEARKTSFMAGVSCGLTHAMYFVFDDYIDFEKQQKEDYKGPVVWPGVEILFSPILEVKPTATSCILGESYVALDKNQSFKFDFKTNGMDKISPAFETFILNIKNNNEKMITLFKNSLSSKITKNVGLLINRRLPKIINGSVAGRKFTDTSTASFLEEVSKAGENKTLSQRRKILFFVGDILKELD